jgi:hypothetical protein
MFNKIHDLEGSKLYSSSNNQNKDAIQAFTGGGSISFL